MEHEIARVEFGACVQYPVDGTDKCDKDHSPKSSVKPNSWMGCFQSKRRLLFICAFI